MYREQGRYEEAIATYRRALSVLDSADPATLTPSPTAGWAMCMALLGSTRMPLLRFSRLSPWIANWPTRKVGWVSLSGAGTR